MGNAPSWGWRDAMQAGAFADPGSQRKLGMLGVRPTGDGVTSINLLPPAREEPWDAALAAGNAAAWAGRVAGFGLVLLAGARVSAAFGLRGGLRPLLFRRHVLPCGAGCVVLPHPSGLNLWWNDAREVERLRRWLALVLRELTGGEG